MAKTKGQNYMHGAAILTVGVIIMKILGVFYKIPLGNILGDEGYSMFMGAYSIYNIFFTLATAGLPVALSRLVAEADANGRVRQEEKLFRVALSTFTLIGVVFGLIMFCFPNWLADSYLENPDAAMSIRAMAPAILLVCMVSAYRGYCQGNGNMLPTTVDEVLEVLFKVISGLILAIVLLKIFEGQANALPMGSAGAIFGVSIGSVISLLYMVVYKKRNYNLMAGPYTAGKRDPNDTPDDDDTVSSAMEIVKQLLAIGIPIAFGACIMALLNSVDSKLCMNRLQNAAGFNYQQAKVLYGVYGKAQTLFNLPAAFITPLTISIVPAISAALARGNRDEASLITEDSLRISSFISIPMGVGLCVMSDPIMNVLYPKSHMAGPTLLAIMGIASFFVCIVLMENAILVSSGKEKLTMLTLISGSVLKIVINWFLVAQPEINIYGAPVGTLVSYLYMASLNYFFMCKTLDRRPRLLRIFAGSVASSMLMGLAAWAIYGLAARFIGVGSWLHMAVCMVLGVGVAVVVYAVSSICLRAITREDMKLIPGGEKLAKLLHMK
ncbi:MAG: polysaccharide biosynthesis protein [Oscillospiraceae bacterium]|nr:polysaccharide biosynthesis protein [Oscillospiraceae bacterium]